MDRLVALDQALCLLAEVSDAVDRDLPSACAEWTRGEVLDHAVGVTMKFTEFATGLTDAPGHPTGALVSPADAAVASRLAWASVDPTRRCRLPFADVTALDAAGVNLFDALAHAWDVAPDLDAPDTLWTAALDAATVVVGQSRDARHYAPPPATAAGAPVRERFLALLGRTPT